MPPRPAKPWRSCKHLPHIDAPGLLQSVTFRLADSLPKPALQCLLAETEQDDAERLRRMERLLDLGHGACHLTRPEVATLVEDALLHFDEQRYRLLAWVIMPNHVHLLSETLAGYPLPGVVQGWKSVTAKQANDLLDRTGSFWARDYYDRYIRDDHHLAAVVRYIERNPVKAGLVARAQDWPFGSASRR